MSTKRKKQKPLKLPSARPPCWVFFFGLVLICGVFFGFGYSMGRGTGRGAQADGLGNTPAETEQAATAQTPAPADAAPPEPQEEAKTPAPVQVAPAKKPVLEEQSAEDDSGAAKAVHVPRPAAGKSAEALQAALASAPSPVAATPAGQPMVQIAAVARREDADVLVAALRQRGYGVVVRNEPQDNLLHVQVGPFADRSQAAAMKQKLLSDGYNAIIKQ